MMKKYISILILLCTYSVSSIAQRPREIQLSDEPVVWSDPWSIAFYIVLPIFLILSAIYLRYRFKTKQREKE
jgi:hypothetical protein